MITRYYNGVLFRRTPISCVAAAFFLAVIAPAANAAVTFPVEAKWSATLPAPPEFAPAFDANRIYVALKTKQLVALLIKDGTTSWSVECPISAPPAAGAGLVYIGSEDAIEARSESDGSVQWRRPVKGRILSLHWDAGWLFAQTEPGPLLALRAADGEILWQKDFRSPLSALPAASADRLYLALMDGRIMALTLQAGDEVWTETLAEPAAGILPVGDRVYIGARDKYFRSLSADDGDEDWRYPTGADILGVPVLDSRRVYFIALDNVLRGHNRNNGSMDWKRVLPVRPFTGPLLSGSTLIVSGVAAQLHAYSSLDGKPAGNHEVKGAENEEMLLAAPPHLSAQDSLILVTKGGYVRALGSPPPAAPEAAPSTAPASPAETPPTPAPDPEAAGAAGGASPTP
ncbi:MAG TPA: PQQ-binding-like beta-propeller repeat protein [Vicinamibacterales bacterium]|nr:PQQ-binding-like beta-propeller repeat protein [Vicinamibacterales bacterium]